MTKNINKAFDWESRGINICLRMKYPARRAFTNWNKCVGAVVDYAYHDRRLENEYFGKKVSNWKQIYTDVHEMYKDEYSATTYCNRN